MASRSKILCSTSSSHSLDPQASSKSKRFRSPGKSSGPANSNTVESAVTQLLASIKQFLEALTDWSNLKVDENYVSDVYVRLGNDLNATVVAFGAFQIDMSETLLVPDDLRNVLEQCLSQDANAENLELYLPTIRQIITKLLQDLREKQSIYRRVVSERRHRSLDQVAQQGTESSRGSTPSSGPRGGTSVGNGLIGWTETDWRMKAASANNSWFHHQVDAEHGGMVIPEEKLASFMNTSRNVREQYKGKSSFTPQRSFPIAPCSVPDTLIPMQTQRPGPQDASQAAETTTALIPLCCPYNLPPAMPPSPPRTTRRSLLMKELPDSLRANLLWSRQLSQAEIKRPQWRPSEKEGIYPYEPEPGTHVVVPTNVGHLPSVVQTDTKQSHDGVACIAAAPPSCNECSSILSGHEGLLGDRLKHTRRLSTEFGNAPLYDIGDILGDILGDMHDFCLNCNRDLRPLLTGSLQPADSTTDDTTRSDIGPSLDRDTWDENLRHHDHVPTYMGHVDSGILSGLLSKSHRDSSADRTVYCGIGSSNVHEESNPPGVGVEWEHKQKAPADYVLPQYLSPNHLFLRHERHPSSYSCGTAITKGRFYERNGWTLTFFAGIGDMEQDKRYPPLIHEIPRTHYNHRSSLSSNGFGDPRFQEASCYPLSFSTGIHIEWKRDAVDPRDGLECAWLQFIINFSWIRGGNGTIYTTSNGGSNPQTNNGSIIHDNSDIPAGNDVFLQQQEHFTSEPSQQVPPTARHPAQIYSVHYRADSPIPPEIAKGQSPPPEPPPEPGNPSQVPPVTTKLAKLTLPPGQLAREATASHEQVSHHWSASWKDCLILMLLVVILFQASSSQRSYEGSCSCNCHCHCPSTSMALV